MTDRARAEFPDFVRARSMALHRAAYLMVGDPTLAQDLVQEALTKTTSRGRGRATSPTPTPTPTPTPGG